MAHYGTLSEFKAWALDQGYILAGSDEALTSALSRASAYIDGAYRSRWPGSRAAGRGQPLEWPRRNAIDASGEAIGDDETPMEVEYATYEGARRELVTPGVLISLPTNTAGAVKREKKGIGPLAKEIEYFEGGARKPGETWPDIDAALSGLISTRRRSTTFVSRA